MAKYTMSEIENGWNPATKRREEMWENITGFILLTGMTVMLLWAGSHGLLD